MFLDNYDVDNRTLEAQQNVIDTQVDARTYARRLHAHIRARTHT